VEAMRLYQEETVKNPEDAAAWGALGTSYFKSGQKADAIRCFEQVIKLRPDNKAFPEWLEKYKAAK
jgi:cytochrome c-type biogenesis protein CcmH/NrfG